MALTGEKLTAVAIDEAVDWYLKHREQPLNSAERLSFAAWLRASPANVREYLAVAALSKDLPDAANVSPSELNLLLERNRKQTSSKIVSIPGLSARELPGNNTAVLQARTGAWKFRGTLGRRSLALAASVAVLGVAGVLTMRSLALQPSSFVTEHGEQRTVRLQDGTLMHLNSSSKAAIRYTANERLIEVERGQLMFEVAPEKNRPFRVRAGVAEALAVGTKFDVYRTQRATIVTVIEGQVLVRKQAAAATKLTHEDAQRAAAIGAVKMGVGEQVKIAEGGTAPQAVQADLPSATAWLQGNIRFYRQPLIEVANEFNRYSEVPMIVEGEALGALKISGVFNAYDVSSFLEFLRRMSGVEVQATASRIKIVANGDFSASTSGRVVDDRKGENTASEN